MSRARACGLLASDSRLGFSDRLEACSGSFHIPDQLNGPRLLRGGMGGQKISLDMVIWDLPERYLSQSETVSGGVGMVVPWAYDTNLQVPHRTDALPLINCSGLSGWLST